MKKLITMLVTGLLISVPAWASKNCFLLKENDHVIASEGDCATRHAPCSTFKIALSVMGYDHGLLIDETHPELPYKEGYADWLDSWKQSHTPFLWMTNSCLWYSHVISQTLGMDKFKDYLAKFSYGNQDVSGDKGKNNGLTHSWLSSSLEISPHEQAIFLQKLLNKQLPVSSKSQEMTKKILYLEELPNGWKLYGKTGSGSQLSSDRMEKLELQIGWFIGWLEKENRKLVFAYYLEDQDKLETYAGRRARTIAKDKLVEIVQSENLQ